VLVGLSLQLWQAVSGLPVTYRPTVALNTAEEVQAESNPHVILVVPNVTATRLRHPNLTKNRTICITTILATEEPGVISTFKYAHTEPAPVLRELARAVALVWFITLGSSQAIYVARMPSHTEAGQKIFRRQPDSGSASKTMGTRLAGRLSTHV